MIVRGATGRLTAVLLATAAAVAPAGCAGTEAEPEGVAAPTAAPSSTTERGPVSVTVRLDANEITVGEKLTFTVDVVSDAGVSIVMPVIEEPFGVFAVRARHTPPDVPEGLRRRWTHTYVLDTFEAGDAEVPAVEIGFTDARREQREPDGEPIEGTVLSEALAVTVRSVLGPDADEADPRDIRAAVDVPLPFELTLGFIVTAVVVVVMALLAVFAAVLLLRRRGREKREVVIPAHEWALAELDRLAEADLVRQGEVLRFYVWLSHIVRQYIERRFGLMAPERTTEEFLREARRSSALSDAHKELLGGFLRAADMVKFALHRPTSAESEDAFDAARGFVNQTRPAAAPAPIDGEAGEAAA
jgi:hypothetical protein